MNVSMACSYSNKLCCPNHQEESLLLGHYANFTETQMFKTTSLRYRSIYQDTFEFTLWNVGRVKFIPKTSEYIFCTSVRNLQFREYTSSSSACPNSRNIAPAILQPHSDIPVNELWHLKLAIHWKCPLISLETKIQDVQQQIICSFTVLVYSVTRRITRPVVTNLIARAEK